MFYALELPCSSAWCLLATSGLTTAASAQVPVCNGQVQTVAGNMGGPADDVIVGTSGNDVIN
ncbi:MAG: hypothetical protein M3R63_01400, partial [Actinomycetota bacterium]|nr:hypothetical protein [Actinomycetota bacterium]